MKSTEGEKSKSALSAAAAAAAASSAGCQMLDLSIGTLKMGCADGAIYAYICYRLIDFVKQYQLGTRL